MLRIVIQLALLLTLGYGAAAYQVIIPAQATSQERFAAQELAEHLTGITGANVRVETESDAPAEPGSFFVGHTERAKKIAAAKQLTPPAEEEAWLLGDGNTLCFFGGGKRGTIYAVYEYLEQLGVLWLTSKATLLPPLQELPFEAGERLLQTPTDVRYMAWNLPSDPLWRVRNRLNGMNAELPEEYGGFYPEVSGGECHFLRLLVPFELCENEHPDWFATGKDGKPSKGNAQWGPNHCLSNPELRAFVVEEVRKRLNQTGAKEVWIGQSDGLSSGCFCARCTAERDAYMPDKAAFQNQDRKRGGEFDPTAISNDNIPWSINTIAFSNAVAEEIAVSHPDVMLLTLAYSYWVDAPPAGPKAADNLIVYLTGPFGPGVCCWFHGYRQGEFKILNDWARAGTNMRVYIYGASNYGFWYPFPNLIGHAEDIQKLYRDGVRGFFDQGALGGAGSALVELRAWLAAKMMRAPETPVHEAIRSFCMGYYGDGGEAIYDYITWYDHYTREHNIHADHGWGDPNAWRKWCNADTIAAGIACRERALAAVSGDAELTDRVERAFMEVDWAQMMLPLDDEITVQDDRMVFAHADNREAAQRFFKLMMKNQYNRIAEPSYFYGEDSLAALWLRDPAVYRLGSDVVIAPALGGRMLEWRNQAGANILKQPRTIVPFNENYESAFDPADVIPWTRADFVVDAHTPGSRLTMSATRDQWQIVKAFHWDGNVLDETLTVSNLAQTERRLNGLWRPILDCGFWNGGKVIAGGTTRQLNGGVDELFSATAEPIRWISADGKTELQMTIPAGLKCRLYFDVRKYPHYSYDYGTIEVFPEENFAPGESKSWKFSSRLLKN